MSQGRRWYVMNAARSVLTEMPDEEGVSISTNTGCECDDPGLYVLDAEMVFDGYEEQTASG